MKLWKSEFIVNHGGERHSTLITYKRGPFQGDSLSPLLFCLFLAPLSTSLSKRRGVVNGTLYTKITHTLFVDDLKIYAQSRDALKQSLKEVEQVSRAVGMKLYCKKCATATMVRGVPRYGGAVEIRGNALPIASMENPYRYLRVMQMYAILQYCAQVDYYKGSYGHPVVFVCFPSLHISGHRFILSMLFSSCSRFMGSYATATSHNYETKYEKKDHFPVK